MHLSDVKRLNKLIFFYFSTTCEKLTYELLLGVLDLEVDGVLTEADLQLRLFDLYLLVIAVQPNHSFPEKSQSNNYYRGF